MMSDDDFEEYEHEIKSVPYWCTECESDVRLRHLVIDEGDTVAVGCDHEILRIADEFAPEVLPEFWERKDESE